MEDGHTMFEYDVNVNDVIQLMIRQLAPQHAPKSSLKKEQDENDLNKVRVWSTWSLLVF